jgi:hypothetical protein
MHICSSFTTTNSLPKKLFIEHRLYHKTFATQELNEAGFTHQMAGADCNERAVTADRNKMFYGLQPPIISVAQQYVVQLLVVTTAWIHVLHYPCNGVQALPVVILR